MSTLNIGLLYGGATLLVMFAGMPIAFALGAVATLFMVAFMPSTSVDTITQNVYEEMSSITLLAIPLFILKGAAIGRSPSGRDLYGALHAWMHRIPGGLGIANVFACGIFAAMAGSSPATCSAIGSAGIPEMRKHGYPGGFAAGIIAAGGTLGILLPPSITMILYAVAAEQSLGRLFLAAVGPALLLVFLFAAYAMWKYRRERTRAQVAFATHGIESELLAPDMLSMRDKFALLPRVLPFVILLIGVMIALYGGYATPSETAGLGAVLALALIAAIYGVVRPRDLAPILNGTLRESTMLMLIIGMSLLYSYVMSYLHISQSAAQWIVELHLSPWVLLAAILLLVVVLGFFLPPVSIILMTAPIILPPLLAQHFDLIWFGVIMTIVMEMGLIHPPVGLNIFVIKTIAPDIPLADVMWGTLPFVGLMIFAVVVLCLFPGIATWFPDLLMERGADIGNPDAAKRNPGLSYQRVRFPDFASLHPGYSDRDQSDGSGPMQTSCDILIIGGGAAGCVLAARLSEQAGTRVMLVEAGQDTPPGAVPDDIQDAFPVSYFNPSYFWPDLRVVANVDTTPQSYLQPRVMGGGSSVMGMWALRGMPGDYDAWRDAGATGWAWSDMLPMFRRVERDRDYDGPEHGRDGAIPVGRHPRETWPGFVNALVDACGKRQLPLRGDLNTDFADGAFPTPYATENNRRVSTAYGYLTAEVRRRPNLEIVPNATATRIVLDGARATGAEIRSAAGTATVTAREVIVSAGGIHSPAVLLRSGIGAAHALKAVGISPQVDLPAVGRGLQNHCVVNLSTWIAPHARRPLGIRTYGVACARLSSRAPGAVDGDLHFQFMQRLGAYAHGERLGMVGAALYAPVSRGTVTLASADPATTPNVDFRFLSDDLDRVRMRQAVRFGLDLLRDPAVVGTHGDVFLVIPTSLTRKLNRPSLRNQVLSRAIAAWLDAPQALRRLAIERIGHVIDTDANAADREIDTLLDFIMPVFHPTGSCRMGRADDPEAVIDPHCRVRGVDGLRVVDASVMPVIPRANTCFPTMAVAERAADLMKAERAA